jgi:hypothetical protein
VPPLMRTAFDGQDASGSGGTVAKFGWWFAAVLLPVVIWPALDWGQAIALALTDLWFERTGHMPSWTETGTVQAIFVVACAAASGLILFLALRAMSKSGAPDGVGWLAAAVSVVIALGAARSVPRPGDAAAVFFQAAPGLAMTAGAVAAALWRRPKTGAASRLKAP